MPRSTVTETEHPSLEAFVDPSADPGAPGLTLGEIGQQGEGIPATLGRYRRGAPIGRGGMGVVFSGTDTTLDRDVAIKVVRARDQLGAQRGAQRLRAEAKTLAALNHPNVVTVLDVGSQDGEVFVVLEKIDGETLADWVRDRRSTSEIIRVVNAAAAGLGAAHDAGVVHRDLKPSNVLIAFDGRVVVADFGLAQLQSPGGRLVQTRGGTRGYIAPEVMDGEHASAASDQYSFAATVRDVLGGAAGGRDGVNLPRATTGALPGATAALRRALRSDPRARFPSVADLVTAISRRRTTPRTHVAMALVLGAVATLPMLGIDRPPDNDTCASVGARTSLALSRSISEQAWAGVLPDLRTGQEWPLDRAAASSCSTAMVAALVAAGEVKARRAEFEAAAGFAARGFLIATETRDDPARASAALLLATIEGVYRADQPKAKRWLRHAAAASSESSGSIQARLAVTEGAIAMRAGDSAGATEAFRRALEFVEEDPDPDPRTHGGVRANLGAILAQQLRFEEALEHFSVAREQLELAAGPTSAAVAGVLSNRASILRQVGRVPEAIADYERALEIFVRRSGNAHPSIATIEVNLGQLELLRGRPSMAEDRLQRAVEIRRTALGPNDPETGRAEFSLAEAQLELGELERAERGFVAARENLALTGKAHLAAYPEVGLARVDLARGKAAAALQRIESALPAIETGPWFSRAKAYGTRASALEVLGRRAEASAWFAASLAAYRAAGPAFAQGASGMTQSMIRMTTSGDNR